MIYTKVSRAFRILIVFHGILAILLAGFLTTLPTIASAYLGTPTQDPYANGDGDPDEPEYIPSPSKNIELREEYGCKITRIEHERSGLAHSTAQPLQAARMKITFSTRVQLWLLNWMLH